MNLIKYSTILGLTMAGIQKRGFTDEFKEPESSSHYYDCKFDQNGVKKLIHNSVYKIQWDATFITP